MLISISRQLHNRRAAQRGGPFAFGLLSTRRSHVCIPTSLCLADSRVDENSFGLDGDALGVLDAADGERLDPFNTIDLRPNAQLPRRVPRRYRSVSVPV